MTILSSWIKTVTVTGLFCLWLHPGLARGEEPWRVEFEAACANSGTAASLSVAELGALIVKCDAVQKAIDSQDESVRKVYLKRLDMCRKLYDYVLESKKDKPD